MGKYQKPLYYGTLMETGREEDLTIAGDWLSTKRVEAGMNKGS
jgi:predicted NAD/FAD-dependent oxidoreductase